MTGEPSSCPSLNPMSPRVSHFSRKEALGRVLARASTIESLQIPVHSLLLRWKYGFRAGSGDSAFVSQVQYFMQRIIPRSMKRIRRKFNADNLSSDLTPERTRASNARMNAMSVIPDPSFQRKVGRQMFLIIRSTLLSRDSLGLDSFVALSKNE